MHLKFKVLFIVVFMLYGCTVLKNNIVYNKEEIEEIYVVYNSSYIDFKEDYMPDFEPGIKYRIISPFDFVEEGFVPIKSYIDSRIVLKYPADRYFFIGKFIIYKNKIEFVPITSSEHFKDKESLYDRFTLMHISGYCSTTEKALEKLNENTYYKYTDIKQNKELLVTKEAPLYKEMFLAALGRSIPFYIVINNKYGKKLMNETIILPDFEELKNNIILKDWYWKDIIYTKHW